MVNNFLRQKISPILFPVEENRKIGILLVVVAFSVLLNTLFFYAFFEGTFERNKDILIPAGVLLIIILYYSLFIFVGSVKIRIYNYKIRTLKKDIHSTPYSELINLDKSLPTISLKSLIVRDFHGIKDLKLNFNPKSKWIFLTGDNAIGKTAILRSILLGVIGTKQERVLAKESSKFNLTLATNKGIVKLPNTKSEFNSFICAYGPSRLSPLGISSVEIAEKSSIFYSLFWDDGLLQNILLELPLWEVKNRDKYYKTKELLIKLLPNITNFKVDGKKVIFFEKDDPDNGKNISELSSGNKMLINMVGDIILRLSKGQENVNEFGDLEGIVLIDEFDIHLHPIRLKNLPTLLSTIFPKLQFIVSTHSPIPLLGVDNNTEILKVFRTQHNGILVDKIIIDNIETVNPNILFSSPIFDMTEIFNNRISSLRNLRTENSWDEMLDTENLDAELLKYYRRNKKS